MARTIMIDPVTRIEGHAKITINLDDSGAVNDAKIHITQFRGFEKFCEGRPFNEMPSLMARTCGICPVSHLMSGSKACDELLAVRVPETGANLRRIMNLAQILQSHALSFFHLSSADFLYGFDADPKTRNIFNTMSSHPDVAKDGIRLRAFGQNIIELLGGKRIHPAWVVPGGVSAPLSAETRDEILKGVPEAYAMIYRTLDFYKKNIMDKFPEETRALANFPSLFLGLVGERGELDHYSGNVRVVSSTGQIVADNLKAANYQEYIGEKVEEYSYLKSPYYKPMGYPGGMYRVGPLARLNVVDKCGTPEADKEFVIFKQLERGAVNASFHYHYARLIEILYCIEKIEELLNHKDIMSKHVRAHAEPNAFEGVGMTEAPRGTLWHHYKIDENGLITWANLIIATGNNNLAMNAGITQAAKHFVNGNDVKEGALNRVEAVIRCFDPCLSCSTHAAGKMAMQVEIVNAYGEVIREIER